MLRRGGIWTVRVHVPVDLRPLIGRREVWRSAGTAYRSEARLRAAIRGEVAAFFARCALGIVAMESCGSAHYWGRVLSGLGHEVRLTAAEFVRPFVKTNKTDAADVEAIWEAAQRPGMRFVALKSEEQPNELSRWHRIDDRTGRTVWELT